MKAVDDDERKLNRTGGGLADIDWNSHRFDDIPDPVARDLAFRNAALDYIRENPGRFLELAWQKFLRFWRPWPYAPEYRNSFYIVMSLLSYGPVLLLSLAYLALWGRQDLRAILPMLMFTIYLTAVHCVLVSSIRYRLPIEPFLVIFASVALSRGPTLLTKHGRNAIIKQPIDG